MKGKICGLLSALFITLGLSLSINLNDTNALKHEYVALPLYSDHTYNASYTYSGVTSVTYSSGSTSLASSHYSQTPVDFRVNYATLSGSQCVFENAGEVKHYTDGQKFSLFFDSYASTIRFGSPSSGYGSFECNRVGEQFGQNNWPSYNWSTLPYAYDSLRSYDPYYYSYSHYYLRDFAVNTQSGLHYNTTLKSSELFGFAPNKFYSLTLPLEADPSVVGEMTQGREIEIRGVFDFSSASYFNWADDIDSNSYFRVRLSGNSTPNLQSYREQIIDCSTNLRSVPELGVTQLEYSCPGVVENYTYYYYGFSLEIGRSSGFSDGAYVWDSDSDWSWAGMYIITDNDETPGANANYPPTGNNLDEAPGSAQKLANEDNSSDADFFSSLVNMFSFNFINPFAPLFQLFSNNDSCANIPTIAGMIHAENDQVCPWFDSTTRNIVTPVLGIASMMLVFGFAVRWLGSSSGNLFEDSGSHDVGNIRVKQRGK